QEIFASTVQVVFEDTPQEHRSEIVDIKRCIFEVAALPHFGLALADRPGNPVNALVVQNSKTSLDDRLPVRSVWRRYGQSDVQALESGFRGLRNQLTSVCANRIG